MPTGDITQIKAQKFIDVFDWLDAILLSPEWAEVQKIWKLNPPETWAIFDLYERDDYPEQILLNKALVELKRLWRTDRPNGFFNRSFKNEIEQDESQENADQSGLRPEEAGTPETDH